MTSRFGPAYDGNTYRVNADAACRVKVVRSGFPHGIDCGAPAGGVYEECEFHYLLRADSYERARCRVQSTGAKRVIRVSDQTDYDQLMKKLTRAARIARAARLRQRVAESEDLDEPA